MTPTRRSTKALRWMTAALLACLALGLWAARPSEALRSTPSSSPGATALAGCTPPRLRPASDPVKIDVSQSKPPFAIGEFRVVPKAGFAIDATVLGRQPYQHGREADISPMDLALGWGPMAEPTVYGALEITQAGRWYRYHWGPEGPPVPVETIVAHSSNMHMIPASPAVGERLSALAPGERVRLEGWLVDVEVPAGLRWTTSLQLDDTGDGACEIVYVCEVSPAP